MSRGLLALGVTLAWLLAACTSGAAPPVTVVLTLRPTATLTPAPPPSAARTPIIIPTATVTRSPTPDASATVLAALDPTEMVATLVAAVPPRLFTSHLSPDGQWRAEVAIYDCTQIFGDWENSYEQLRLVQVATGAVLEIETQFLYCGGLGAYGLEGLFWSSNSRYFYYTDARAGWPDGCGWGFTRSIIGWNVSAGAVEFRGGGPFSPVENWIASWQGPDLIIWAFNGGIVARTPAFASEAYQGPVNWSPDGRALVYVQSAAPCSTTALSYVVRLDLPDLEATVLVESDSPSFSYASWDVPGELRLFEWTGKEWRYNFDAQELSQVP